MEQEEMAAASSPELAAMAGEMQAIDADALGPEPGAVTVAQADPGAEIAAVIGLVVGILAPALPYLPGIYTEQKIGELSAAYVPVAAKYGWDVGGVLGQYGAEIALAAVAVPTFVQTAAAHRQYRDEQRQAAMRREADARAHFDVTRNLSPVEPGDRGGQLQAGGPTRG